MNKQLPECIVFNSPELFYTASQILKSKGWRPQSNARDDLNFDENFLGREDYDLWSMTLYQEGQSFSWRGHGRTAEQISRLQHENVKFQEVRSLRDFLKLLNGPALKIAGHDAKLSPCGVKVGCTFVKWEEVDALIEARKQMES